MKTPPADTSEQVSPTTAPDAFEKLVGDTDREAELNLPRQTPFQRFWCTRVLSSLSFQMLAVAMGWHIYARAVNFFAIMLRLSFRYGVR
jgi:hypothetical protein